MTRIARAGAVLALALLTALALAGPAAAKKKPHKDKRAQSAKVLPKKWAKQHKADSDRDGIKDGDENAGTVATFDGTTLTISLAIGGALTGTVDELTDLGCDDALLEDDFLDDDEEEDDFGDEDELDVEDFSVRARLAE